MKKKRIKWNTDLANKEFEKENYILLTKEYKNNKQILEYICSKGHIGNTRFVDFLKGHRCLKCWKERSFGKNSPNWKGGVWKSNTSLYDTYAHQIDWCEEVRRDPNNKKLLQVRCTYCNKWFNPPMSEVGMRIKAINNKVRASNNFYCSEKCKKSCCMFGRQKHMRGFFKDYERYRIEVDTLTNQNFYKHYWQINPKNLKRGDEYHLDHIYPVVKGYKNNIPPEDMADASNLQMLPAKENLNKSDKVI